MVFTRLLSEILKETEDVEEIEYLADGSWRPIREEKEKERSSTPECPLLDICKNSIKDYMFVLMSQDCLGLSFNSTNMFSKNVS